MIKTTYEIGKPMDKNQLRQFINSGKVPVRVLQARSVNYDLKIEWSNSGNIRKNTRYRMYFGNFFKSGEYKRLAIGAGITYKTANVVLLLDPPPTVEKRYDFKSSTVQVTESGSETRRVGVINNKTLIMDFIDEAKKVGIDLAPPGGHDEKLTVLCTLQPYKAEGAIKVMVIKIDEILYS